VNELPIHLLLPLLASLLFVCGLIFIKRASAHGVSPWTVTFVANVWAAIIFSSLWLLGGSGQPFDKLWQPAIIAGLFVLGQVFTFSAIHRGDVSVATPVFGVKVVFVTVMLAVVFRELLPMSVWIAAVLATLGIGLVQWSPRNAGSRHHTGTVVLTITCACAAAFSFATFDVLVQSWAPQWGTGRLLPAVFWIVGALSIGFLPFAQTQMLADKKARVPLLFGTLLVALQALCLVSTLANFGDAARVNVVYAMRGMWGVILAWFAAVQWGGNEATLPNNVMLARLTGAGFLTAAVVLVVTTS